MIKLSKILEIRSLSKGNITPESVIELYDKINKINNNNEIGDKIRQIYFKYNIPLLGGRLNFWMRDYTIPQKKKTELYLDLLNLYSSIK